MNEATAQVLDFPEQSVSEDNGPYEASPQVEDGHVRIANELFDAMLGANLGKREWAVLMAVIRKTYGFNKTADDISSSQLAEMTGLTAAHCRETISTLVAKSILTASPGRFGKVLGVQKDYTKWLPSQIGASQNGTGRPKTGRGSSQNGTEGRPKTGHTKDNPNKQLPKDTGGASQNGTGETLIGQAENVYAYLNQKTGRSFQARKPNGDPSSNTKYLMDRLKDGYSVEDCKRVIDHKVRDWANDERMASFLRPQTLFRPSKFEDYLGQANSSASRRGPAMEEL